MELKTQTSHQIEIVTKKEITIRSVLNLFGIFAVLVLVLSIFTIPISINSAGNLHYNEEIQMESKKIKEFLFFILSSAFVYYLLVNMYYKLKHS
ncbi:hypothetical protein [Bacillus sp. PS06]|uniref:hypothetical protein n=1 Tax=Bacillus sp. PS06 TaxID=2764176 RepID=UPI00177E88B4|nr:hypothetical protein [Bacillus sp. PS06]MBD8067816.1 hypothetical protein [Bacillus sp. PS06]